jgi:phospholipid-translocating ATPase
MSPNAVTDERPEKDAQTGSRGHRYDRFLSSSNLERIPSTAPQTLPQENVSPNPSPQPAIASNARNGVRAPRARQRGHSLRRSLFSKSTRTTPLEKREAIELAVPSEPASIGSTKEHDENTVARLRSSSSENVAAQKSNLGTSFDIQIWKFGNIFYERARKTILHIKEVPASADGRHIYINEANPLDERTRSPYIHNTIRSSRYSLVSFFPRQLFAQFSKLANAYFLVISIMQVIPGLSTTGQFTTLVPLLVFIGISMGKEGYDDIRRWKLDKEENTRSVHVLGERVDGATSVPNKDKIFSSESKCWVAQKWSQVKVGDIVQLGRNDQVPADMILMYADGGTAYMETMALDGETNLKNKQPPVPLLDKCTTLDTVSQCHGELIVEDPSMDLYRFEGRISMGEHSYPITTNEILYRGSVLRNTPLAAGIVCYTGEECRIRQNANKNPRIKAPALQALVNRIVLLIAGFVVVLSLGCAFGYRAWDSYEDRAWFLQRAGVNWGHVLTSFIIMFNTLLPLSLYVSMEIVKVIQIVLMNGDVDMFDAVSNTPMQCQTSTINEELGQVSYIFSDKTGTLTKNEMKVKKLSCAGYVWNHAIHTDSSNAGNKEVDASNAMDRKPNLPRRSEQTGQPPRKSMVLSIIGSRKSLRGSQDVEPMSEGRDRLLEGSRSQSPGESTTRLIQFLFKYPLTALARKAKFFLLSIALCHTCIPERSVQSDEIQYQATSPDELALVTSAQEMGYLFMDRQSRTVTIKISPGDENGDAIFETYEILHVIEFTSNRKRMSVIVKQPDGRICIHCKGADTMVRDLLRLSDLAAAQVKAIEQEVDERKSLEAHEALRRRSTAPSIGRHSFSPAASRRKSSTVQRKHSVRYSVDQPPSDREDDIALSAVSPVSPDTRRISPRTSVQLASNRASLHGKGVLSGPGEAAQASAPSPDLKDIVDNSMVSNEPWVMGQTLRHINEFANDGLRTLLHASRYLSEEEYCDWAEAYREATTSLVDREGRIHQVANLIEKQFELIGATAIEDRLQDGVPDTIERLRRANIKLWMLTGDKRETAISISRSCKLAKDYSTFIILDHVAGSVEQRMATAMLDLSHGTIAHGVLVVDGETLASIEGKIALKTAFLDLAILVDSVICCRASPSQKAMLVKSIRTRVNGAVTLAIGDGANDVAMIQEADVGIGISGGKEGLQAARTSDYSIAQFRFLCKLLLVHGRYNYDRISKYILGTTYKEMLFYLTQALYQRHNGYTGTSLYESWSLSWYNTLFTSLPIIFLGAFMADLSPVTLLAVPELYTKGQRKGAFNFKIWLFWTFMATAEAMLVFFIMYGIFARTTFTQDNGLFAMGVMTYTACVLIVNVKLQVLEIHNKTILAVIALVLSVGGWFAWNIMLSAVYKNNVIYNVKMGFLDRFGRNALWWLTLIVIVLSFLLFELAIKALKAAFFPSDVDLFQVLEQDPILRRRFEDSASSLQQQLRSRQSHETSLEEEGKAALEADREAQVEAILQDRASNVHHPSTASAGLAESPKAENTIRKSIDVFSKGFGSIKKEDLH